MITGNIEALELDTSAWDEPTKIEVDEKYVQSLEQELAEARVIAHKAGLFTEKELEEQGNRAVRDLAKNVIEKQEKYYEENPQDFKTMVAREYNNLKVREAAKHELEISNLGADFEALDGAKGLDEWLLEEDEDDEYRIEGLMMQGHITTVAAYAKAGKSSFALNRLKAYADGGYLFGYFKTNVPEGKICYLNYELSDKQLKRWIRSIDIQNRDKIIIINARGANLFIQNKQVADKLIDFLNANNVEILEIDPLQAALIGSVNDDTVAAEWINALQYIIRNTGVKDCVVTTHTGHSKENRRSIGSARWVGFPDNLMLFERVEGEQNITQLEIEQGRDITLDPIRLEFDPDTRVMTYKGEAKQKKNHEESKLRHAYAKTLVNYEGEMVAFAGEEWIPANDLMKEITDGARNKDNVLRGSLKVWVDLGFLREEKGPRNRKLVAFTPIGLNLFENSKAPEDFEAEIDRMTAINNGTTEITY